MEKRQIIRYKSWKSDIIALCLQLLRLSAITSVPLIKGETLVFFDEVQQCPDIVTAIKFLVVGGMPAVVSKFEEIFNLIPPELNAKNKRFILKRLNEYVKFDRGENSFLWLTNNSNLRVTGKIIYAPIYMTMFLEKNNVAPTFYKVDLSGL